MTPEQKARLTELLSIHAESVDTNTGDIKPQLLTIVIYQNAENKKEVDEIMNILENQTEYKYQIAIRYDRKRLN